MTTRRKTMAASERKAAFFYRVHDATPRNRRCLACRHSMPNYAVTLCTEHDIGVSRAGTCACFTGMPPARKDQ